jgi:hypothetical protein
MRKLLALAAAAMGLGASQSAAQSSWFDFKGSLGPGRHQRYVSPVSNPLFNETPYITTELRPIVFHQTIPDDFITGGGDIDVIAAEVRIALTERLGFIASKDGYADIHFKGGLPDENGFANVSAGLKYAVISDPASDTILTIGAEYEAPTGDLETGGISLQGRGDGFVDLFVTGAKAWGPVGFQASAGVNLALDGDHDSSMLHYSAHLDLEALPRFFPLLELNGFTTVDDGSRTGVGFEGVDLVNFGATDAGTVVTAAIGARYVVTDWLRLGAAFETPLTERQDLLGRRFYFDLVLSY